MHSAGARASRPVPHATAVALRRAIRRAAEIVPQDRAHGCAGRSALDARSQTGTERGVSGARVHGRRDHGLRFVGGVQETPHTTIPADQRNAVPSKPSPVTSVCDDEMNALAVTVELFWGHAGVQRRGTRQWHERPPSALAKRPCERSFSMGAVALVWLSICTLFAGAQ
jgi:hypothetical protein